MSSYPWKSSDFKWWVGWFQSTHRIEIRFWRSMISILADFPACYLSHLLTVGALLSRLIPATSSLLNGQCSVFTSCLLLPLHPHLPAERSYLIFWLAALGFINLWPPQHNLFVVVSWVAALMLDSLIKKHQSLFCFQRGWNKVLCNYNPADLVAYQLM